MRIGWRLLRGGVLVVAASVTLLGVTTSPLDQTLAAPHYQEHSAPWPPAMIGPTPVPTTSVPQPSSLMTAVPSEPELLEIEAIDLSREFGSPIEEAYDPALGEVALTPPMGSHEELMRVYRWSERVRPALPSEGTTFVIGHTCTDCESAFNSLQLLEGHTGTIVKLMTRATVFVYEVARTDSIAKHELPARKDVSESNADLILIACKLKPDGSPQTDNFVVWAKLRAVMPR